MNRKTVILFISFIYVIGKCAYAQNDTNIQNKLQYHKHNNISILLQEEIDSRIRSINKNSEIITKNVTLNTTIQMKRKKLRKSKKRRRNKVKKNIVEDGLTEFPLTESTTHQTLTPKVTKRKNRKQRKGKKKNNGNNILKATSSTEKSFYVKTVNSSDLDALVVPNANELISSFERNRKRNQNDESFNSTKTFIDVNNSTVTITTPVTDDSSYIETKNSSALISANTDTLISSLERNKKKFQINGSVNSSGNPLGVNNFTITIKKKNRCAENNGGCSQICKPKGKGKCACIRGYKLARNRKKCVDVDECRIKNGGCKDICRNIQGAFYCDCRSGFRLSDDSRSCQDINECHLRNGHGPCQDTCTNTHGSYTCDCSQLNGTRLGKDKHSCEDINECEERNPGCSHLCINTRMGGFCSCPEGMELMSDYKTCQDVDECEDAAVKSLCERGCINTIGSYYCEEDFQNDQTLNTTKVPSCPPLDLPQHGFITCFRNNSLPYDTFTKNGRRVIRNGPGTKCQLECPVGFKLLGGGRFVCGISGKWIIKRKGLCIEASYPQLQCPPDQTLSLENRNRTVLVRFPPPQTNVRWKIVKSYPKWAKKLKGKLGEGHHSIQFSVTDPASKLSSTCSFSIIVKK